MTGWWCNVPILKHMKVNGQDDIPYNYYGKKKMFETTNQMRSSSPIRRFSKSITSTNGYQWLRWKSPRSPCAEQQACAGSWGPPWHKSSGNWTFGRETPGGKWHGYVFSGTDGRRMYTQTFKCPKTKLFADVCSRLDWCKVAGCCEIWGNKCNHAHDFLTRMVLSSRRRCLIQEALCHTPQPVVWRVVNVSPLFIRKTRMRTGLERIKFYFHSYPQFPHQL